MPPKINCLVIGIDFGTTYTGIAFRDLRFNPSGKVVANTTHVVTAWPGGTLIEEDKAPSEISYSTGPGGERQWGFNISEGAPKLSLMKLELEHEERMQELQKLLLSVKEMEKLKVTDIDFSNGQAMAFTRSADEVVKDYLVCIREHLIMELRKVFQDAALFLSTAPIDLVVTVPAGWSENAKDRTLGAFRKAGFDSGNIEFRNLRETILMLEPEAAALHTVSFLTERDGTRAFRAGDCFVMCDAGGGTVDLISYRIKQTNPTLILEEVGIATGGRFGASFIDKSFTNWLREKLGDEIFLTLLPDEKGSDIGLHTTTTPLMQHIMRSFEPIKRSYDGHTYDGNHIVPIPLPGVLNDLDDDPKRGIVDGNIQITDDEIRKCFDPWIDSTLELLRGQLFQVRTSGFAVRHIFLSGGFGESEYLKARIKEFAKERRIEFNPVDKPWLSVINGAVTKGCELAAQNSNPRGTSQCHYGVSTSKPFSKFKHAEYDAYIDPYDGEKKAGRQVTWLIKKGDTFSSARPKIGSVEICRKFGVVERRVFSVMITACSDDCAPDREADLHAGGITTIPITYDLSKVDQARFRSVRGGANGQSYFCATLKIEIEMELQHSVVRVLMDGQVINSVEGNYQ